MKKDPYYSWDYDDNEESIPFWELHKMKRDVLIDVDSLDLHMALRLKRHYDFMDQVRLASHLGIAVSTLSDYENGKKPISRKHMPAIERYLFQERYVYGIPAFDFDDLDDEEVV